MKKRKLLYLFPLTALLLSGCSFQEALDKAKGFLDDKIINPIKDIFGPKDEQQDEDEHKEDGGGETDVTIRYIELEDYPHEVIQNKVIEPKDVSIKVIFSDKSEKTETPEEVICDTSKVGETELVAKYKGEECSGKVIVKEAPITEHAGTEEDPFTGKDAVTIAQSLQESSKDDKHPSEQSYYIKGVVGALLEDFNPSFGNFTFTIEENFEGYRLKFGPNYTPFTSATDLEVGDTVTMYAQILNFKGTYETSGGYITKIEKPAIDANLVEVTIEGNPQTAYLAGAAYNHDGLTATAHYDNGETQDVTLAATWEISKATAEMGDESIKVTAHYKEFSAELVVNVTVQDSSTPQHAGTEEDPFTGMDACIVAAKLQSSDKDNKYPSEESYYIKDKVTEIKEFSESYGNYTFLMNGGFEGYRLKNGPEKVKFTSDKDIEVGDTVTIYAQLLNFGGTYENHEGYVSSIEKDDANTIVSLIDNSAQGIPASILQGESLDRTKITVGVNYKDGHTGTVNPDKVELDTSVPGENVEGKLIVGELEYKFTIEVLKKEVPAGEVHDVLNLEFTGVSGTTYTEWSGKTGTSGAVYAGQSAGSNNSIQLRSKNENSGIVSTVSGGKLLKVLIDWNENTVDGRTIDIYGKNTAYTSPTELYGENAGELIGSAAKGTTEVTIQGEFEYVGVRSNKDALYLNSITFVYAEAAPAVEVTSVEVSSKNLELDVSDAPVQLSATVLPEDATDPSVTWSSSNESVAKVSADGLVTPVASGNATIIAKAGEKEDKCEVKVTTKVQSVSISPTLNLVEGNTGNVVVTVLPEGADDASYTLVSSDPEVATVDSEGLVTAVKEGTATISVTTKDGGKTAECLVTVSKLNIPVDSVELECDASIEMYVGDELTLKAHGMPENATEDRSVEWALQDSESGILAVYSTGKIEALKEGTVTVRATSVSNSEAYEDVTVKVLKHAVASVELNKEELTLTVGTEETLVATVSPEGATYPEVSWKSSDEEIAKVDDNGVVTGIAVGEATITAEADGKSATCVVNVEEPVAVNTVELAYKGAINGSTDVFTFEGTVVSITGNSYVLQDGEYGINIYNKATEGIALGKLVEVVSTVKLYNGCPQTNSITSATVKGEGVPQTSAPVASKDELDALNHNVLAHVGDAVYVSKNADWASGKTAQFTFKIGGNDITISFDKQGYDADKAAIANNAVAGAHYQLTGLITAAYSGNNQFTFSGTSGIVKTQDAPIPDPTSVTITSGDSLAVGSNMTLTATVEPDGAAQDVEWEIVEGFDYASLSDGVLTGVAAGEVKVKATAVGYENVYAEKTITVSSSVVPTEQVVYTLDGTVTGGSSGYAEASEITQGGVVWSVEGNTTMNPWRIGGKNLSGVDRVAKSTQAVTSDDLSKVSVTTGTKTLSAVNSITIKVGSTEGASDLGSQTFTTGLVSNTLEFERPSNADWSNAFISVVFNVNAASSNQYIQLIAINLYAVK